MRKPFKALSRGDLVDYRGFVAQVVAAYFQGGQFKVDLQYTDWGKVPDVTGLTEDQL